MSTDNAVTGGRSPSPAERASRAQLVTAMRNAMARCIDGHLDDAEAFNDVALTLIAGPLAGLLNELEALRQTAVGLREQLARQAELLAPAPDDIRMNAYYYSFDATGIAVVDRILSAVATAGKMAHNTSDWYDERDWLPRGYPCTPAGGIQAAANESAAAVRALSVPAPPEWVS